MKRAQTTPPTFGVAHDRAFGDRVRRGHDVGLSQEALALRAGVNRSYYVSLEAGRRNPSLETICRIAVALECDAADLVHEPRPCPDGLSTDGGWGPWPSLRPPGFSPRNSPTPGAVAQLAERCLCKADVVGSIPISSTRTNRGERR